MGLEGGSNQFYRTNILLVDAQMKFSDDSTMGVATKGCKCVEPTLKPIVFNYALISFL